MDEKPILQEETKKILIENGKFDPEMSVLTEVTNLEGMIFGLDKEIANQKDWKNQAYKERDRLVALMSKIYPAHLCRHSEEDIEWEDDWRWIVCVHTPAGQATWHINDSELPMFAHLPRLGNHWDGHSTAEKYVRLGSIKPKRVTLKLLKKQIGI